MAFDKKPQSSSHNKNEKRRKKEKSVYSTGSDKQVDDQINSPFAKLAGLKGLTLSTVSESQSATDSSNDQANSGASEPPTKLYLKRETKGRKGKGVTIIEGFMQSAVADRCLKELKQKLGVGGASRDQHVELQTTDRERIKALLEARGHKVIIAGS